MIFKNVSESFNHYKYMSLEGLEQRAREIKGIIDTDENADITSLNIEIQGIKEAKENIKDKEKDKDKEGDEKDMDFVTGTDKEERSLLPNDENIFGTKEYRSAFYKEFLGKELNNIEVRARDIANEVVQMERRADQFTTSTNTPSVIPTITLDEVISKARKEGRVLSLCRNFNIPSGVSVPVGIPGSMANWNEEGKEVETDKPNVVNVEFGGYEIIKIFSISAKVKAMSIDAFENYLVEELYNQVLATLNHSIFHGTGLKQGTGLLDKIPESNVLGINTKYEYTDFTEALALLKTGYGANAKFVMNNATLYREVYGIVDSNKRPIFTPDPRNELVGHILGKEVEIDDNLDDGVIVLGNFDYMGYNLPEGILIETSRESSFKSGKIDIRALAIADCKPIVEEAFIKLEKTSTK